MYIYVHLQVMYISGKYNKFPTTIVLNVFKMIIAKMNEVSKINI